MKELMAQISTFLGDHAKEVGKTGTAEIEIIVEDRNKIPKLSEDLKNHIVEIGGENTLAKINFKDGKGVLVDSFSLTQ